MKASVHDHNSQLPTIKNSKKTQTNSEPPRLLAPIADYYKTNYL